MIKPNNRNRCGVCHLTMLEDYHKIKYVKPSRRLCFAFKFHLRAMAADEEHEVATDAIVAAGAPSAGPMPQGAARFSLQDIQLMRVSV